MSIIQFPTSPYTNQTFTVGSKTWIWNGYAWDLQLANTAPIISLAQGAYDKANTASANTVYTQGVDATQNTNIQTAWNTANNALPLTGGVVAGNITANNLTANLAVYTNNLYSLGGNGLIEISDIGIITINPSGGSGAGPKFIGKSIEINSVYGGTYGGNFLSLNNETKLSSIIYDTVQIVTGTNGGPTNTWSFSNSHLIFPDNTTQNTAFTDGYASQIISNRSNTIYNQGVDAQQNTWISSNVAYIAGVDATQNTRLGVVEANTIYIQNNLNTANANIAYILGVDLQQNTWISSNVAHIAGVDAQQNTWISSNNSYFQGALNATNTSISTANTFLQANDALTFTASRTYTDNANTTIQSQIATKVSKSGDTMSGALTISNTSSQALYVAGTVYINQDLNVTGNIYLNGNATTISSNNIVLDDSLIYLAEKNPSNLFDIGVVGHFVTDHYQHTGVVRDHIDNKWKFFSNVSTEPSTTINFGEANTVYDTVKVGTIEAVSANINNINLLTFAQTTAANTVYTFGVDAQQNTNITGVSTFAQASYNTANTDVTSISASAGTYGSTTVVPVVTLLANGRVSGISSSSIAFPVTSVGGAGVTGAVSNTQLLASIISVDGAGSGLDADLLDGQHATYYTTANNLTGAIPSTVLGANSLYIGTTAITLNRASAAQALTGIISIDGGAPAGQLTGSTLSSNVTSSSLTSVGTITSGTWSGSFGAVSGASLTNLYSNNLFGTIPSTVLANSTHYIGTTSIALNRASAAQSLTGITSIDGSAASVANALTFNNGGAGAVSGTTFNGSATQTISYNTVGASPLAGSSSLTTTGTVTSGTWSGSFGAVSGANLTGLTAGNLSGTIPSGVLGNSTHYVGTTAITLNRASASQTLTGVSIDGTAANLSGTPTLPSGTTLVAPVLGTPASGNLSNCTFPTLNQNTTGSAATFTSTTQNSQFNSIGVGTAASATAGEIRATNNITAYYSDERLKNKLGNITNALEKVLSLNGFYYEANELAQQFGYSVKKEVGVSAQEVQRVMPEIVVPAPIDDKYLTVYYDKLVPLLIEAIKEQQKQINELKELIK